MLKFDKRICCSWPDDIRSQGINIHGIDPTCTEYAGNHPGRVDLIHAPLRQYTRSALIQIMACRLYDT